MSKVPPSDPSLFDFEEDADPAPPPPPGPPPGGGGSGSGSAGGEDAVPLHDAARSRYLNYALSVITARALPDVRDGLKPVQRRILFSMWQQGLRADAKHRKSATVVGNVLGNFHPHGDASVYDALVRMAQPFSLRYPLVDGSGNFGSLDGDNAAAYRYTECRLARLADQLLIELEQDTVAMRPNFDGTKVEPVVLPARIPNLLINGSTGIAVGMATNIPPHNLGEVCTALVKLLDNEELTTAQLCRWIKGPDFPTGGVILNTPDELKEIYRTGSGPVKLRATWEAGPVGRTSKLLYVTSIPYAIDKSDLVARIGDIVLGRKLPPLVDVRDVSTDDVRIELELKKDADEKMVMAYLFKHTPLQTNFNVNLTCLIPTEQAEVGRPERLDLKAMLWHFLHFRLDVVTRRLQHELAALSRRQHLLEGFAKIFDALDEILRIVRKSEGKADAARQIMARFGLDAEQTDAILELKIYRLARLEIQVIQQELDAARKRARELRSALDDEAARWAMVRREIEGVRSADPSIGKDLRRTTFATAEAEVEYSPEDFIVDEDGIVLLSRDGWIKRQKDVKDLSTTRLREGDAVMAAIAGSTRATAIFFTNYGAAYTCRFIDIPASTGYGEPIQRLFKFKDGERVVAAFSADPRLAGKITAASPEEPPPDHLIAVTSDGYSLRFSFEPFLEPSTRAGRRYARTADGAEIVGVERTSGRETLIAATRQARAMLCRADEVNFLSGPGRGVILIKIDPAEDRVLGFIASVGERDLLLVETSRGAEQTISTAKYEVTGRGGRGRELLQRGQFARVITSLPDIPNLPE
ncbi:MAG: DNA topoisomerase IV subunit A [Vicinamibacteraceae bacterium]